MATPTVGRQGDINETAVRRFTRTLVDGGVDGLFPCGSIGEFSSLSPAQRRRLVAAVVEASGDRPVLAGCGDTSLSGVLSHAEAAAEVGADAAVVVTPYYLQTTQSGLGDFYRTVADRSPLPVVLYNIPGLTTHHLSLDLVTELTDHGNVVGIKDTSGDMTYFHDLCRETPAEFAVLQGATELSLASLDVGGDGLVAGPANVFPTALAELHAAYDEGDRRRAAELMRSVVAPTVASMAEPPTAAAVKHLVECAGHDIGGPVTPLPALDEAQRDELTRTYRAVAETAAIETRG